MKFLYTGDKPIDVKVPRNNGAHIDTVPIFPSPNPYETNDEGLFNAVLKISGLFEIPQDSTAPVLEDEAEESKKGKSKKKEDE